jgi:Ca2+-transporting ATPase
LNPGQFRLPAAEAGSLERPGGDDLPSVYSGTLVSTGGRTELGKIGSALRQILHEPTSLQKETGRLVRTLAIVGLAACVVAVVVYALARGGAAQVWKEGLLAGIAMAMAILPQEFPVVLTIFLALGAWRLSRLRVLTRRMPAIETLGATTVLCVDKTGTLTQNRMTLRKLAIGGRTATIGADAANLSGEFHALLENAILASRRDPFDPMELALQAAGDRLLMQTEHLHPEWSLLREHPLTPRLLAVSQAWKTGAGEDAVVAGKGAPEAIAALCRLSPERCASVAA